MQSDSTDLFGQVPSKRCIDCKAVKPYSAFRWNTGNDRRKRRDSVCAECRNRRSREWNKIPENKRRWRNGVFKRNYGITLDEYEGMLASQSGVCAICKQGETYPDPHTGTPRRLAVDHDHETKVVRGLICSSCNQGLGHFRDNRSLLLEAAAYLLRHGTGAKNVDKTTKGT